MEKINLLEKKQVILEIMKKNGPCLPSSLSSKLGLSLLLTSALLSEMKAENLMKVSNLKIGGSPLYYIEGQETLLENFTKHLQKKEQEAFELLKQKEVVDEQHLEPAHRVALRNIRDFAFLIHVKTDDSEKIFWRFHAIKPEAASEKIAELLKKEKKEKKLEKKLEPEKVEEKKLEKEKIEEKKGRIKKLRASRESIKAKIKNWLDEKKFVIEQELENALIVSMNSEIGKLHFLVVPNIKKNINEADLSLAYQQGQSMKMPVLLLADGKLTKKAQAYLEKLGKLIVVEKL